MTGWLEVETHFLEMRAPPARSPARPPRPGIAVTRAAHPTVSFYRYLYGAVGAPWLWYERDRLDDRDLAALIQDPAIEIHVLTVDGVSAGYVELDCARPSEIQILYFGLVEAFIGQGLGRYFLDWSIDHAWRRDIERLWLHTCSLDHPRALPTYLRAGFVEYAQERGRIRDPRA